MKGEEERTYLRCMYVYLFRDIRISLWLEYIPVVYTLFAMCFFRTWALSCSSSSGSASQLGGSTRCSVSAHCLLKFVHFLLPPLALPSLSLPLRILWVACYLLGVLLSAVCIRLHYLFARPEWRRRSPRCRRSRSQLWQRQRQRQRQWQQQRLLRTW